MFIEIGGLQNLTAANFALTAAQPAADMIVPLLTVSSVAANPASGELVAGQTATLTVDFNEAATVAGWVELLLNDGGVAKYDAAQLSARAPRSTVRWERKARTVSWRRASTGFGDRETGAPKRRSGGR